MKETDKVFNSRYMKRSNARQDKDNRYFKQVLDVKTYMIQSFEMNKSRLVAETKMLTKKIIDGYFKFSSSMTILIETFRVHICCNIYLIVLSSYLLKKIIR